jgi:hypothetical protein
MRKNRLKGDAKEGAAGSCLPRAAAITGPARAAAGTTDRSGDQVSFTLRSDNPDGTVQTYQGTATVTGGKIVTSNVVQTGGPTSA